MLAAPSSERPANRSAPWKSNIVGFASKTSLVLAKEFTMSQNAQTFRAEICRTVRLDYLLFLPRGYGEDPEKRWPLVLYLHGMGERGDDLELIKKHGPPKILDQRDDFDFVVVSPQCPADTTWAAEVDALDALLDQVIETYAIDTARVYLTGLSMGGYGTWHLATAHPERFAAIAPICGGAMPFMGFPDKVCALKDVPVWAFHGARDEVVPLAESAKLVSVLKKCGGNVRFTIYPDAEHDSWTETYDNPELYAWFLSHTKA
jgi:predicted peptidase